MNWHPEVALTKCYLCLQGNEVLLSRTPHGDKFVKEANGKVLNKNNICSKCKDYMKQGIIVISVKENNPEYRTGGWWVMTIESIKRIFTELGINQSFIEQTLSKKACFLSDEVCDIIGLQKCH